MNRTTTIFISIIALSVSVFLFMGLGENETIYEMEDPDKELRNKIGQMLIIGFRGTEIDGDSSIVKAIESLNLGGVILFDYDVPSKGEIKRNIIDPEQTKRLVADLKESGSIFVAVDAEGGSVNRLKEKDGFDNIPSAQKMGEGSPETTEEYGYEIGKDLKELGFNLNFAPVVDVNINPDNPIIGKLGRSFSDDPYEVSDHATRFIKGLNRNGIVSVIKHFPGHGSSKEDSHLGMVDVTETYRQEELIPYKILVSAGYLDMVMTAHVINGNIDPDHPASLSSSFIQGMLRDEIGFEGVVVSDDMQMGAIIENYGYDEALIAAVNAGSDMLIISNNGSTYDEKDPYRAVDIIFDAVRSGKIEEGRIVESYERILSLKKRYSIIQ